MSHLRRFSTMSASPSRTSKQVTAFFVELDLKVETVRFIHASRQIALTRHGELPGKDSVYC